MKVKVLKTGVTVENAILDVGAVVDMSEKDATRLSGYGLVEVVDEPEPEPEFVRINVMERIVSDKIIYFMRQFECCTCEKCIADTIALTLNGLPPKYIVTEPAAEAPLLSFYTNHFISEITVEATKACMTVKENPRHKNGAS